MLITEEVNNILNIYLVVDIRFDKYHAPQSKPAWLVPKPPTSQGYIYNHNKHELGKSKRRARLNNEDC